LAGQEALEVDMAVHGQRDERKNAGRQGNRRKGDRDLIKIDGEKSKGKAVLVRRGVVSQAKIISVWSWYEELTTEWCRTL
jgi:hypothetical protein